MINSRVITVERGVLVILAVVDPLILRVPYHPRRSPILEIELVVVGVKVVPEVAAGEPSNWASIWPFESRWLLALLFFPPGPPVILKEVEHRILALVFQGFLLRRPHRIHEKVEPERRDRWVSPPLLA